MQLTTKAARHLHHGARSGAFAHDHAAHCSIVWQLRGCGWSDGEIADALLDHRNVGGAYYRERLATAARTTASGWRRSRAARTGA